ncbi:4Fe-4S dicluster domain-containing protein [candidate division FCPU426 bacterium]|nr:4Fe-4S dicluster domain-containing protein [candidate division FCPU426 bacterium]
MPKWLPKDNLIKFINQVSAHAALFAQQSFYGHYHLVPVKEWQVDKHTFGAYRPFEPLKSVFFPPRESLGSLFQPNSDKDQPDRIVFGVKNCDLQSLRVHDYVFLHSDPIDPEYSRLREKTMLFTFDCTDCLEICFCTAVGEQPFPKSGFDINFSPLPDGFILESGSVRGETILTKCAPLLEEATASQMAERDAQRQNLSQRIARQATEKGLKPGLDFQKAVRNTQESALWKKYAADCVECGACNMACCTCHCFLLVDGLSAAGNNDRVKQWDSCLYRNFARVAGGANPRPLRAERLYNRFDKKFNFFKDKLGTYACDGCGRCIEACTGKIDIRDVLAEALHES